MTKPDLMAELAEVVDELRRGDCNDNECLALANRLNRVHAELEAAVRDAAKWKGVESVMAMAADKIEGQITSSCGLLLIDYAGRNSAGSVELRFGGVSNAETGELGDWTIRIDKAAMHNSAREG